MPGQTDVQKLIQGLAPGAVNNGNPNTIYNTAGTVMQPAAPPPTLNTDGTFNMNLLPPAASLGPTTLNLPALTGAASMGVWQAPAPAAPLNLPTWQYINSLPANPGPAVPPPVTDGPPITDGQMPPPIPGSGRNKGCVTVDSRIYGLGRAGDVEVGDTITVIDPATFETSEEVVTYSEAKLQPVVRITTKGGTVLECSESAPISDETGEQIEAKNLLGVSIPVSVHGMIEFETVMRVEELGEQMVQHISCADQFFLAGKEDGKYLLHHNKRQIMPGQANPGHIDTTGGGINGDWLFSSGGGDWADQFGAEGARGGWLMTNAPPSITKIAAQKEAPTEEQATVAVKDSESWFKAILETTGVNVGQAWDYITKNPLRSILAVMSGNIGGLLIKAGVSAIRTPDKKEGPPRKSVGPR